MKTRVGFGAGLALMPGSQASFTKIHTSRRRRSAAPKVARAVPSSCVETTSASGRQGRVGSRATTAGTAVGHGNITETTPSHSGSGVSLPWTDGSARRPGSRACSR